MSQGFSLPLPDNVLKLLDDASRKALGKYGTTMAEATDKAEAKSERELHEQIGNLLRLRGIEFIHSRMDRKTTQAKGTPDFIFAVMYHLRKGYDKTLIIPGQSEVESLQSWPIPCAWELKLPGRVLDPDQKAMFDKLTNPPNSWCCRVIHNFDEALAELKKLGL